MTGRALVAKTAEHAEVTSLRSLGTDRTVVAVPTATAPHVIAIVTARPLPIVAQPFVPGTGYEDLPSHAPQTLQQRCYAGQCMIYKDVPVQKLKRGCK